jgi:ATP-dependent RNA helicase RhlE
MYNNSTPRKSRGNSFGGSRNNSSRSQYGGGRNRGRSNSSNRGRSQNIDPKRFVKAAKPVERATYQPEHSFEDFEIDNLLKRNLVAKKYDKPTQIQDQSVPIALKGGDIIGIANTGTGKTVAFLLPLLHKLLNNRGEKALIIAPTRELALQIQEESRWLARGGRLYDVLIIGGAPMGRQLRDLQRKPEIIVGTPGRLKDHLERGTIKLDDFTTVVLDEVDRMLDMGFINDIRNILQQLPKERQSLFFSATMSRTIEQLIQSFTKSPETIMARTAETSDNVEQSVMHYDHPSAKMDKLHDLLNTEQVTKTLIFSETKRSVEKLSNELSSRGFKSDAMHGDKSQNQRQRALKKFRDNHVEILVATDVAARGIDVDGVTHVVNYDVPQTYDDYTHRIGRTGRGDNPGNAVTFIQKRQQR